ncbi:transporter substrate-binding domain-containing protein [Mariniluteicoccus flavus]
MRSRALAAAAALALAATACSTSYAPTPLPSPRPVDTAPPRPGANCPNPVQSYDPVPVSPLPPNSTMTRLADRGRLVVGVSADAVPFASRNAQNGDLEGFEIDLAKALAKAMFNDESKLELRVIGLADLDRTLADGDVDLVVRQVAATCERQKSMRLSAPYASTPVRVLSRANAVPDNLAVLAQLHICAVRGSDIAATLRDRTPRVTLEPTDTACLVRFQRGEVDAVAGTAPVLAGLARQDPYAAITKFDLGTADLTVAARADRPDLAAWVNGVLAQRSGGAWAESWNRWVRPYAGDAQPPKPTYGRAR